MSASFRLSARARLPFVALVAALLLGLLWGIAPVQLPVVAYKLLLCLTGALTGYVIDGAAFPYAAPDSYLVDNWRDAPDADGGQTEADFPVLAYYRAEFRAATARRAAFMLFGMLCAGVGL